MAPEKTQSELPLVNKFHAYQAWKESSGTLFIVCLEFCDLHMHTRVKEIQGDLLPTQSMNNFILLSLLQLLKKINM